MPTAAILNQERERWARKQATSLSATSAATSASIVKQTQIPITATSASFSGSLSKLTKAVLAAVGVAFSGSLSKKTLAVLSAIGAAFNGSLVKKTLKAVSAVGAAFNGSLIKKTLVALSATSAAFSGSVVKKTLVVLAAISSAFNGSLAEARLFVQALAASMAALNGSIIKKTTVVLSAISQALSGSQSKKIFRSLSASAIAFSGNVNKATQKFLSALLSAWNAIVGGVKSHPQPSVFHPISMGATTSSFGTSEIGTFSNKIQPFYSSGILSVSNTSTADGWGNLGQQMMPNQLLVAPGNGGLSDKVYYVVAGGDITLPASATNVNFQVTLFENYFSPGQVKSDPISVVIPQVQAGQTTLWSIVCKLSGNGRLNGILRADTIVDGQSVNVMYSNNNPNVEPKLQLSVGVNLTGSASEAPRVRMRQFEIQRG